MVKRVRAVRWLTVALAASVVVGAAGQALAQRTTGATGATAGSLALDESSKDVARSSCVLMLQRSARYTAAGPSSGGPRELADLAAVTTAMTTTGLIDPAAKAALGLDPREWPKVVRIEITPAGAQAVKLAVSVNPGPNSLKQAEPSAALLRELVNRGKAVASQLAEPRRQETKTRLDELEKRRAELKGSLESLRKRASAAEMSGVRGFAVDPIAEQRRQLEFELATKRPRLQAIKEFLPGVTAQADEIGKALRGLVAAREALVVGLEKAVGQGKGDPVELLRVRADLAEARVRLAEWGSAPSSSPSPNVRDELVKLEVDVAALEARLKALPTADPAKTPAEDYRQVRSDLFHVENENTSLENQYRQAQRDYEQLAPPTLVVLDGQPK
jgi:hypothetical protein